MNEVRAVSARLRLAKGIAWGAILALAVTYPLVGGTPAGIQEWMLLAVLTAFGVISYLFLSIDVGPLRYSATFVSVMIAAALLGPVSAAMLAIVVELIFWTFDRYRFVALLCNIAAYGWAGVLAGLFYGVLENQLGLGTNTIGFYVAILPIALLAHIPLFAFIVGDLYMVCDGKSFADSGGKTFLRLGPSHLVTYAMAGMIVFLYVEFGLAASAAILGVALMNQFLIQRLLAARGESKRLALLNSGILASLLRGLHLRDNDTARHSAAVARYAREISAELGWSKERQELVHTAALLHDIGKFAFSDRILSGDRDLTEQDWQLVKQHPETGADLLRSVKNYEPVAEIVAAHHERPDGAGYPLGLARDDIPEASRLIAVADAYDVMTARGGYNKGRSSFDALRELRAGIAKQFDGQFVEALARVLAGKDLEFRHADDADFDAEVDVGGEQLKIAVG